MKKIIMNLGMAFITMIVEIAILFILMGVVLEFLWQKKFNTFNYESAKEYTIEYLSENESDLELIVDELYRSKQFVKNPHSGVSRATYYNDIYFNLKNDVEYVVFDLDSQGGALGGQSYGLIYSNDVSENLIIYDESKYEENGNNIFIKKKIKDNWYFYYKDYDGKVDIDKIR